MLSCDVNNTRDGILIVGHGDVGIVMHQAERFALLTGPADLVG